MAYVLYCPTFPHTSHPSVHPTLLWCSQVGLWDVDYQGGDDGSGGGDGGGYDGVLMFEPHSDYISSLKWLGPSGQALLTGSYDGLVRRLDVATGAGGGAFGWQHYFH